MAAVFSAIDFRPPETNHGRSGDFLNFVAEIQLELVSKPASNVGEDTSNEGFDSGGTGKDR